MANIAANNNDALANLKPLITPTPVPWWPPAPGWWLVGIALLLGLIGLTVWIWKRWRHYQGTRYQREAIQLLALVEEHAPEKQLQQIAEILRRAAICAWGRERTSTQNWHAVIEMAQKKPAKKSVPIFDETSLKLLSEHLYRNEAPSAIAMKNLQEQATRWLKTLPKMEQ